MLLPVCWACVFFLFSFSFLQLLHIDGIAPFISTISSLTRSHLKKFLRTQRNAPPLPVPRLVQPFSVDNFTRAPLHDDDDLPLPFGVTFQLRTDVPCDVQAFWGVDRPIAGALQRGGLIGLQQRLQRGSRRNRKEGTAHTHSGGGKNRFAAPLRSLYRPTPYSPLDDSGGKEGGGVETPTLAHGGAVSDHSGKDGGRMLFPSWTFVASSPPQSCVA